MSTVKTVLTSRAFYAIALSVILSVAFVTIAVNGATTISTNINTGGTLTVSGDVILDTDTLYVDVSEDRVGVGTTTPAAMLAVGEGTGTVTGDIYLTGGLSVSGPVNSTEGTILFRNQTTNPTGVEGLLYYNSDVKRFRLYDGASWVDVATTTGGGGLTVSDNNIQLIDQFNNFVALGTTTIDRIAVLTVTATSSEAVPLRVTGATSTQTANLFEVLDETLTEVFTLDHSGVLTTNFWNNGFATTTSAAGDFDTEGSIFASSTVIAGGLGHLEGGLISSASSTIQDLHVQGVISASSTVTISGDLFAGGGATTTSASGNIATDGTLSVGPSHVRSAVARMVAGVCYLNEVTIAATTTAYAECSGATGITAGDNILVTATSSLASDIVVQAASSTSGADDVISVLLLNTGHSSGSASTIIDSTTGTASLNFWAFR